VAHQDLAEVGGLFLLFFEGDGELVGCDQLRFKQYLA
jgi:hypothetical protein